MARSSHVVVVVAVVAVVVGVVVFMYVSDGLIAHAPV
jgi:hypothetical protein